MTVELLTINMNQPNGLPKWADPELSKLLPELCAKGECQSVEFKRSLPEKAHDIGRSIAGFASTNNGHLIYGIADDGEVCGLDGSDTPKGRDRIIQRISSAAKEVRPPVPVKLAWAFHEGRTVCVVSVEKGPAAIYFSGERPMLRHLNMTRPAQPDELEKAYRAYFSTSAPLPPLQVAREIGDRLKTVIALMNADREEKVTVAHLARAMYLNGPAELDAILDGRCAPSFAMLDRFCDRFGVCKDWLESGRELPFRSPLESRPLADDYVDLIDQLAPEVVYAVLSDSPVGQAILVLKIDHLKFLVAPMLWHVSDVVGAGGSLQLLHLYRLFKRWSSARMSYQVVGRVVHQDLTAKILNGAVHPGVLEELPLSHWWDDLTDLESTWTNKASSAKSYGKNFVLAQDIIRTMLAQERPKHR